MAKVDLNIKELRIVIVWTEDAISQENEFAGPETEWGELLATMRQKLQRALDRDLDRLIETIRTE